MTGDLFRKFAGLEKRFPIVAFYSLRSAGSMSLKGEQNMLSGVPRRQKLFSILGVSLDDAVFCQQTHSDNILFVKRSDAGRGSQSFESGVLDTDALVTKETGIALNILVADCVPILIYDFDQKVAAAVHAGWRGTVKFILQKTISEIINRYGSDPKNIHAVIGPSIGPECFEVQKDVVEKFEQAGLVEFVTVQNGHTYIDLWSANKQQLLKSSVPEENIEVLEICNHCEDNLFSFRRDKTEERFVVGIMLK